MDQLQKPDCELTARILSKVDFHNRIVGCRMRQRMGAIITAMYSLKQVVAFLHDPFPQIDFEKLQNWIRTVLKDPELAGKIALSIESESNDHDRTIKIRNLIGNRLCQCSRS
jgi:hypothetical protein